MSFCPIKLHLSSWWTGTNVIYETSPPFPGRVVLRCFPGHKYPGAGMFPWRPYWSLSTRSVYRERIWDRDSTRAVNCPWQEAYSETMLGVSKQPFSVRFCSKWLVEHCTGTDALEQLVVKGFAQAHSGGSLELGDWTSNLQIVIHGHEEDYIKRIDQE